MAVFSAGLLWRFLGVVRRGDPFADRRCAGWLLAGGLLVAVWALALPMVRVATGFVVLLEAGVNGFHATAGVTDLAAPGLGLVCGGVLVCLSEVFRRGRVMSHDLAGLV